MTVSNILQDVLIAFSLITLGICVIFYVISLSPGRKQIDKKIKIALLFFSVLFLKLAFEISENANSDAESKASVLFIAAKSIYATLQTFTANADFVDYSNLLSDFLKPAEYILVIENIIAPIVTATFILSLFREVYSEIIYKLSFCGKIYVFSELNEKSIALAENIYEESIAQTKDSLKLCKLVRVVFCDTFENNEEKPYELIERARTINAMLFKKDITKLKLIKKFNKEVHIFIICEDGAENITQALYIIDQGKNKYCSYISKFIASKRSLERNMYVFSDRTECELLLENADFENDNPYSIKVRKVNEVTSTILNHLSEKTENEKTNGYNLFFDGYTFPADITCEEIIKRPEKIISVAIVGLGKYGKEMLKTLSWYCQMPGYRVVINAYDIRQDIKKELEAEIPDLLSLDCTYNNQILYEASYEINIHPGTNIRSQEFLDELKKLKKGGLKYIFVSLGSDALNIETSVRIRSYLHKFDRPDENEIKDKSYVKVKGPYIETIVYDSRENILLNKIKDLKGNEYKIGFFGDIEKIYSENLVVNSELSKEGLVETIKLVYADGYEISRNDVKRNLEETKNNNPEEFENYKNYNDEQIKEYLNDVVHKRDENMISTAVEQIKKIYPKKSKGATEFSAAVGELMNVYHIKEVSEVTYKDAVAKLTELHTNALIRTFRDFCSVKDEQMKKCDEVKEFDSKKFESEERNFWRYSYNFNSTIAKIVHSKLKDDIGLNSEIDSENSKESLSEIAEHTRWNAYMRSIGFTHSGDCVYTDTGKDFIAKTHKDLVSYKELSEGEHSKDA